MLMCISIILRKVLTLLIIRCIFMVLGVIILENKAKFIKIRIILEGGKKIWIPFVPLLASGAKLIAKLILKYGDKYIKEDSSFDRKQIEQLAFLLIKELKNEPPFTIVEIKSTDGTNILIETK